MIWKRTVGPVVEPVDLETEAKPHLRVDINDDDDFIESLIQAAREYFEETTRRSLLTQTWRLSLDNWPVSDEIELPRAAPLQSVSSVVYIDSNGNSNTLSSSAYDVDTDSEPGRVKLKYGESWPSVTLRPLNPIQVTYLAGYTAAGSVPQRFKRAILLLVGHWYEHREGTIEATVLREIPLAMDSLVWLNRVY